MEIKTLLTLLSLTTCASVADLAKEPDRWNEPDAQSLEAWQDMRFGMFIHWGPVSLKGTEIGWSRHQEVPVEEYDRLYKDFNPEKFDAKEWVAIAKDAGMKYLVLTTKHHDGFCLWDTKTTEYDIMSTPFRRDVVKELAEACEEAGIMFCTYYSISDWYHPDWRNEPRHGPSGYLLPEGQQPDMDRYEAYMKAQLKELLSNYGHIGVMWFDGEWEASWTHERGVALYHWLRDLQPSLLVNNRVDKGRKGMEGTTKDRAKYKGDFDTPEQQVGHYQPDWPWESCITICEQWAWKPQDRMKSLEECIQTLVRTAGGGGNLLLNVGPKPDGRIEPRQAERLREIGDWLEKYGEAIYGTQGGPFKPSDWGVSTHRNQTIYVHVMNKKVSELTLPPLKQKIIRAKVMHGKDITFEQSDGAIKIMIPKDSIEPINTIIVLELDKPCD